MKLQASLSDRPPYRKFLIIVGLTVIGAVLFSALGALLARGIFGIDLSTFKPDEASASDPSSVNALRLIQGLAAIGTFIVPVFASAFLFSDDVYGFLGLRKKAGSAIVLLTFILLLVAVPLINWMVMLNSNLQLPGYLHQIQEWMLKYEQQAAVMTGLLTGGTGMADLLLNLLVVAAIPAIGEELLFRGLLQRQFSELSENRHAGVILTAILFSALHMQFLGFLPRFVLGVLLGYLYFWSSSLWVSVLAHFFNNALAVVFTWTYKRGSSSFNPDTVGTEAGEVYLLAGSVIFSVAILFLIRNKLKESNPV